MKKQARRARKSKEKRGVRSKRRSFARGKRNVVLLFSMFREAFQLCRPWRNALTNASAGKRFRGEAETNRFLASRIKLLKFELATASPDGTRLAESSIRHRGGQGARRDQQGFARRLAASTKAAKMRAARSSAWNENSGCHWTPQTNSRSGMRRASTSPSDAFAMT